MGDEADVGLVDAHSERDRRDHHHVFGAHERRLVARPHRSFEPGVVGQRGTPGRSELLGDPLGLVAARRIDDPGARLVGEQLLQLAADAVARPDVVADVGPVEAGDHQPVLGDAELREDIGPGPRVGGRGQRQPRHVRPSVEQWPQQPVIGAEIVAPFADAMRFVDRDQRQRRALEQPLEPRRRRPLGRNIEQVQLP